MLSLGNYDLTIRPDCGLSPPIILRVACGVLLSYLGCCVINVSSAGFSSAALPLLGGIYYIIPPVFVSLYFLGVSAGELLLV